MAGREKKHNKTRKNAIILFADIIGASEISNNCSVEDYDRYISDFHRQAIELKEIIFEGYNEPDQMEFVTRGDEVVLILHSDDKREDLRLAIIFAFYLKLAWFHGLLNRERVKDQLDPREIAIGIHQGPVIFSPHPYDKHLKEKHTQTLRFSSEGYAINLAKRIEGKARMGKSSRIFLSETAHYLVDEPRQQITFEEPKQFNLKGVMAKYLNEIMIPDPKEDESRFIDLIYFLGGGYDIIEKVVDLIKLEEDYIDAYIQWAKSHPMNKTAGLFIVMTNLEDVRVIKLIDQYPWAYQVAGVMAGRMKDWDLSIRNFRNSVEIDSSSPSAFYNLGTALLKKSRLARNKKPRVSKKLLHEACENFEKAGALKKDDEEVFNNWGSAIMDKMRMLSRTDRETAERLFDEAFGKYKKATEIKKDYLEAFYNWGNALDEKALMLRDKSPEQSIKLFDEAIEKYRKVIGIKEDDHGAFSNWGVALDAKARLLSDKNPKEAARLFDEAVKKCRKAIEIKKDYHRAFNNWGVALNDKAMLFKKKNPKKAEKLFIEAGEQFKKAIEIKQDYHEAFNNWTGLLLRLYQLTKKKKHLKEALNKAREGLKITWNVGLEYNKACALALIGEKKEAYASLRKVVTAHPGLKAYAKKDEDWKAYCDDPKFIKIVG